MLNEDLRTGSNPVVMRKAIVVTLIALCLVVGLMRPDEGEQTVKIVEAISQEKPVKVETNKKRTLTIKERKQKLIKENPNDCNTASEWIIWPSGVCKTKTATKAVQTSSVKPTGTCHDWMRQAGITDMVNAHILIMRESGCNPNAVNPSSGACGIGQQLPCGKWSHTWNDPIGGMKDMQIYVMNKYGSWANAVAFWEEQKAQTGHGWY